jgi:LacI family transcriptional regulator
VHRLTIKDVARAAGVHPATASRALNPRLPGRISAETTERVTRAAAALGYVVDPVGRSLRTQRSGTIGVLVPDLLNPFYPPVLRGVEGVLRANGFEALIASTDNDVRREAGLLEVFRGRRCEGYLVASASRQDETVRSLVRDGVPVVLVNRLTDVDAPSVTSDDAQGIGAAVAHLRGLGHTAIAHLTGPADISVTGSREKAFRAALAPGRPDLGRPRADRPTADRPNADRPDVGRPDVDRPDVGRPIVARAAQYTAAAGETACLALLRKHPEVTAILAGNDLIAVGCYAAFGRLGLRCPDDVSLIGINDMPLAEWLRPALTTVAIPQQDLGAHAARLIVAAINDPGAAVRSVALDTALIVRGSTGPVRPAALASA